ncbi:hypothetical protein GH721_15070 [Kriegella sp. EG-1]|nr:hypothetical protein [Flavobacteriaceae bacterium EG-1]
MNKLIAALLLLFSSIGCSDTKECCAMPVIELTGRYNHEISDCNNFQNSEVNCVEWIEFINDTQVNLLYGGSDVVDRFNFTQNADYVTVEGSEMSSFKLVFVIKGLTQLERLDNGEIWEKE